MKFTGILATLAFASSALAAGYYGDNATYTSIITETTIVCPYATVVPVYNTTYTVTEPTTLVVPCPPTTYVYTTYTTTSCKGGCAKPTYTAAMNSTYAPAAPAYTGAASANKAAAGLIAAGGVVLAALL